MQPEKHLISIARIRSENDQEISEVGFRGSVRKTTVQDFRDYLEQAGARSPFLMVKLGDLDYLCSSGLGVLLEQSRRQEQRRGWLRIVSPSTTVTMILSLSGVSEILRSVDSEEEALRDLPKAA